MRVNTIFAAIAPAALIFATPAMANPSDDLSQLIDDYWAEQLKDNPVLATSLGVRDYDDQVGSPSLEQMDTDAAEARAMLARLDMIPLDRLTATERTNALVLKRQLQLTIDGNRFGQRTMLFTTYYGWHQGFAGMGDNLPFRTGADYHSYLARMAAYPAYNDAALAVSDQAIAGGYVLPCVVLGNVDTSITGVITDNPEDSRYYKPFTRTRPVDVDEAQWAALQAEARQTIADVLKPAYAKHAAWFRERYMPACTQAVGVSEQPGGRDYYVYRVREMTTTEMAPDEIHALGLSEVARIRAEMEAVAAEAGYDTREAYVEHLRTDPQYYAQTPEELMAAASHMSKILDGLMPGYFGLLPRLPYGVKEIPAEIAEGTTTAYYNSGSPESGIAGNYFVNTSKLDQRPLFELPALSAHEAVPGHHHQIALNQEVDIPDFRRHGAFVTAFVEGWGLYSEFLGIEMGIYDTPAKNMGRLSYEMWRATRLVVDTGIHSKGWSKQRAVDFMKDNTALSEANIDAEVNRYISWPGQALAYKIGELKIRELRTMAESELGNDFDIRAFHDAVLGQGSVPLSVLEAQIADWVAQRKIASD